MSKNLEKLLNKIANIEIEPPQFDAPPEAIGEEIGGSPIDEPIEAVMVDSNTIQSAPKISEDEKKLVLEWQKTKSPEAFKALYDKHQDTIKRGIWIFGGGYQNQLPPAATKARALEAFHTAISNYKINSNASLSSWITSQMRILQRYVRDNKDIAHIPENRLIHVGMLRDREQFLTDKLGRAPTMVELADDLKWPIKKVKMIKKELKRDLVGNSELEFATEKMSGRVEELLRGLYFDLPPVQQKILESTMGWDGPRKDLKQIARELKVPEAKVRYERDKIAKRLKEEYGDILKQL